VAVGVGAKKVSWILDADIAKFFDTIEHLESANFPARFSRRPW
jgi:hypothetical protein